MTNDQAADVAEMDALFRRVDFAADAPDLAERLWAKIQAKLEAERELSEDELFELAAAGTPDEAFRSVRERNRLPL